MQFSCRIVSRKKVTNIVQVCKVAQLYLCVVWSIWRDAHSVVWDLLAYLVFVSFLQPSSSSSGDQNISHLILSLKESLDMQEAIYGLTVPSVEAKSDVLAANL